MNFPSRLEIQNRHLSHRDGEWQATCWWDSGRVRAVTPAFLSPRVRMNMVSWSLSGLILTFHICRANSDGGLLSRTIVSPSGTQAVASSFLTGSSDSHGNNIRRLLQERDESRTWYSNAARDLGRMVFHLNALQGALTNSENRGNSAQARLAEADARTKGENSLGGFYSHNLDFIELWLFPSLNSSALSA
jgi:hypothetical protein